MSRPRNPELVEAILDAAEHQAARKGYSSVTMRGLARKVGVTPTTLYYYFSDKEALFEAVKFRILGSLDTHIRESIDPDASPADRLFQLMVIFLRWMVREKHRAELVFESLPPKTELSEEDFEQYYRVQLYAEDLIKRGVEGGELTVADPEVESNVWLSLLYGTAKLHAERRLSPRFWKSIDPLVERIEQLYSHIRRPKI
jgi:AcrR family transcriptional regulator